MFWRTDQARFGGLRTRWSSWPRTSQEKPGPAKVYETQPVGMGKARKIRKPRWPPKDTEADLKNP
jgi:hypothetical protein